MNRFDDFAESPFGPIGDHMAKVKECVALVQPMFECALSGSWTELEEYAQRVFRLEHEADKLKNDIRENMPRTFSLPIYRGDLLAYLKLQDDIADSAEDVAVVLTLKNLAVPKSLADDLAACLLRPRDDGIQGFLVEEFLNRHAADGA